MKIDSILMQLENRKEEKEERLPDHHSEENSVANVDAPGGLNNKKIKPYNRAEVKQILEIIKKNRHKLDPPPICRIK